MGELIERIKRHEGLRLRPYTDSVGKLTIGYGRNLDDVGITESEADDLLRHDVHAADVEAHQFSWFRNLNTVRQDVIIEMIFNLGLTRFLGFKRMIEAVTFGDYDRSADEMLDSLWHNQVGRRAELLAGLMREG